VTDGQRNHLVANPRRPIHGAVRPRGPHGRVRGHQEFLTPIEAEQWAKLAVVVFFTWGTAGSGTSTDAGDGDTGTSEPGAEFEVTFDSETGFSSTVPIEEFGSLGDGVVVAILALAAVGILLGLGYLLVGSVMEFVLVESLRSEAVSVRAHWREHRSLGVRLFLFRVVFLLAVGGPFVGLIGLVVLPPFLDPGAAPLASLALLAVVPLLLGIGLLAAAVNEFTTAFAVPIMLLGGCGVLAAWGRLLGAVRAEPAEFLVYAGLKLVLSATAGAVVGAVIAIPAVLLFLPVGALGGFAVVAGDPSLLAVLAVGVLGVIAIVVLFAVTAVVQVPVVTYFRHYALLLLGDVDADLDLIPDRRAAIRADGSGEEGGGSTGDGGERGGEWDDGAGGESRKGRDDGAGSEERNDGDDGWGVDDGWSR
jgi:uncharacterized membrane protein YgcG